MIPKIIHYCWFGPRDKSPIAARCIESWKTYCPDFELKEWNETNTQSFQNKFFKDALRKGHYAFASDCIRVKVLEEYGGIYMDLDMLLLKPINDLQSLNFFTGFEVENRAAFGFFGAIPKHRFIQAMVNFYENNPFNEFSLPVITHTFKELIQESNLLEKEKIFAPEYFYAFKYEDKNGDYKDFITEQSIAVHLWDHSWSQKNKESVSSIVKNLIVVLTDYLFYGYPGTYFKRYFRGFSRKLYHKLIGKSV